MSQGALSSVLGRLEAAGAVVGERARVRGRERRVKVYVLTPRGHFLASAGGGASVPSVERAQPPAVGTPRSAASARDVPPPHNERGR